MSKTQDAFHNWLAQQGPLDSVQFWHCWKAASELSAQRIAELEQQRDELLVALEATVEAIRLFRNEPQLERLVSLRATAGYVAMDAAMDRGTDAIDAARGVK